MQWWRPLLLNDTTGSRRSILVEFAMSLKIELVPVIPYLPRPLLSSVKQEHVVERIRSESQGLSFSSALVSGA